VINIEFIITGIQIDKLNISRALL